MPDLENIAGRFVTRGRFLEGRSHGSGHINDTYRLTFDHDGVIVHTLLQHINHHVFKHPPALMDNIVRATRHIRTRLEAENARDIDRRVLNVIPTREGHSFLQDDDGLFWRMYVFIEGARSLDIIETEGQAYEAARAFGHFQRQLSDLPGDRLHETIPQFHDTPARFRALELAIAEDPDNRAASARSEIDFFLARQSCTGILLDAHRSGDVPERIIHNDTKLNNVMFDDTTSEGICVIDLDTIMPGLALFDFGDMVRTATNTGAEDERDLNRVRASLPMFEALTRGYLSSAGTMLNDSEVALMPIAGQVIALEIGMRFLTDHLLGDTYFKIHRAGHNLDRCRTQVKLVQSLEEQEASMADIVSNALAWCRQQESGGERREG